MSFFNYIYIYIIKVSFIGNSSKLEIDIIKKN